MKFQFLLSVTLTSIVSLGAIVPIAMAQERPECFLIDNSGELTDLTDICNASQGLVSSETTEAATTEGELNIINNNSNIVGSDPLTSQSLTDDNLYFLGEGSVPVDLSTIGSTYYIDNEIGNDYTAYLRRYQTSPSYLPREVIKDRVFRFENYFDPYSLTSIFRRGQSRVPYIIYRYPVR
ncbi:hypothetical protein [Myxosarcina sp. GI1]|uniref:hypothetical protein n=1 Tax=Myxosarcina sp. GI1 TaxID=1541065 RepID=UPI00055BEB59|nr:hypothetical protein [Myxosarcina sp. GI1]